MSISKQLTIKELCPDFDEWPESWMGLPEDRDAGIQMLKVFESFILFLIDQGLAKKTLRRHIDNAWILGGELIRNLHLDDSLRTMKARELIAESVDSDGGPYCRHLSTETELKLFDSTCRKLHKFLESQK